MTVKSQMPDGSMAAVACGLLVRARTDNMRKLHGATPWRVVDIDSFNVVLKSTSSEDKRTLYFGAKTFLQYWKPVGEEAPSKAKPMIGDRVVGKDTAVLKYYGQQAFRVVGLDGPYVVVEREKAAADSGEGQTSGKPVEWLAKSFYVCFGAAQ